MHNHFIFYADGVFIVKCAHHTWNWTELKGEEKSEQTNRTNISIVVLKTAISQRETSAQEPITL